MTDLEATVQRVQNSVIDARILGAKEFSAILARAFVVVLKDDIPCNGALVAKCIEECVLEYELMMLRTKK